MLSLFESARDISRTECRERAHARVMRKSLLIALSAHLVLFVAINPSMILRLFRTNVPIGYPGAPRRGELAPQGPDGNDRFTYFRVRRYTGPVTLSELNVVGSQPRVNPQSALDGQPVAGAFGDRGPAERITRGKSGGTGGRTVIELGEDWSVVQKTGPTAQSEKFQALKIVRPEYPPAAVRAGIEGLVKLKVEVDTEGSVVGVRAIENSSRDSSLALAAMNAMFQWKFKPYHVKSDPVPFTLLVPFRYRLID